MAAHECYIAMLKMDNHLQMINIEEQQTMVEPIERLEEVLLDDSKPDRTTKIGTSPARWSAKRSQLFLEITRMYLPRAIKTCQESTHWS